MTLASSRPFGSPIEQRDDRKLGQKAHSRVLANVDNDRMRRSAVIVERFPIELEPIHRMAITRICDLTAGALQGQTGQIEPIGAGACDRAFIASVGMTHDT